MNEIFDKEFMKTSSAKNHRTIQPYSEHDNHRSKETLPTPQPTANLWTTSTQKLNLGHKLTQVEKDQPPTSLMTPSSQNQQWMSVKERLNTVNNESKEINTARSRHYTIPTDPFNTISFQDRVQLLSPLSDLEKSKFLKQTDFSGTLTHIAKQVSLKGKLICGDIGMVTLNEDIQFEHEENRRQYGYHLMQNLIGHLMKRINEDLGPEVAEEFNRLLQEFHVCQQHTNSMSKQTQSINQLLIFGTMDQAHNSSKNLSLSRIENERLYQQKREEFNDLYVELFIQACLIKKPRLAEVERIDTMTVYDYKIEKFDSIYLSVPTKNKVGPLCLAVNHNDLTGKGIFVYLSTKSRHPCHQNNDGSFQVLAENKKVHSFHSLKGKTFLSEHVYIGIFCQAQLITLQVCCTFRTHACMRLINEKIGKLGQHRRNVLQRSPSLMKS